MQHVFHATVNDCVPGIIAALAADNDVRLRSKHVDNFAFALVAPLHSDQNCVRHVKSKMGKKFSRRIRAGRSRDLPTDNKLAASPRKWILGSWPSSMLVGTARCAVRTPQRGVPTFFREKGSAPLVRIPSLWVESGPSPRCLY